MNKIYFTAPAADWNEALPIGNGRMGGMIYGRVHTELIQLNEDSVWHGGYSDRNNKSALENLPEIRRLILEGHINEAQELCSFALSGTPEKQRHYEPLGNLYLMFDSVESDIITDYKRELDIDRAVVAVSYCRNNVNYKREFIASYPDGVIAIRLMADKPGQLSFYAQIARGKVDNADYAYKEHLSRKRNDFADRSEAIDSCTLVMESQCGGKGAVELGCAVKVKNEGGEIYNIGNYVRVKNADAVTILIGASTTFRESDALKAALNSVNINSTWEELLEGHVIDYDKLYNRVKLNLEDNSEASAYPMPKRLESFAKTGHDNKLMELFFNFGRYLMISSSRQGSLPANLQGVWNMEMQPPWGSKYTININIEMNYWISEVCNLSECHMPLIEHIERMRENGRRTAKVMYGCGGFMAHHNTDIWGDTAPQDIWMSATYWVMGAAWLCLHIWEHYCFTQDMEFLKKYYGTMCEAAEFILDYLIDDGEYLVTCPTLSPENSYCLPNGETGVICKGASMDNQIIRELFTACIKGGELLDENKDFCLKLEETLKRIAPISIGKYGQIMEWNEDYEEIDLGHRHISQLFALHPGTQISPEHTPQLAQAARKTLERRLSHGGGHTGWSRAWIINMWARLRDGEKAFENVKALLQKSVLPNLFDNHPPFQIDGNFGGAAGIAEMLVQSHENEIVLLPALPKEWANGSVSGLCARGGIELSMEWKDGKVIKADFTAVADREITIKIQGHVIDAKIEKGKVFTVEF